MKSLVAAGLLVTMVLPVFGVARADSPSVEQTLMQMERDWTQAGLKKDAAALDKIIADDWVAISYDGKSYTKAQVMADLKSGASATQSIDLGSMKVREFANTAIVTGSDTEKSTYKGKDTSGKYVWTDVFVKRQGRWQAAASQSTKVEK
jgi:ketosteroid isomerase-like protein